MLVAFAAKQWLSVSGSSNISSSSAISSSGSVLMLKSVIYASDARFSISFFYIWSDQGPWQKNAHKQSRFRNCRYIRLYTQNFNSSPRRRRSQISQVWATLQSTNINLLTFWKPLKLNKLCLEIVIFHTYLIEDNYSIKRCLLQQLENSLNFFSSNFIILCQNFREF